MLTEGQISYSVLFLEVQAEKKIQGFQKHFTEDIFLYLLLINLYFVFVSYNFLQPQPYNKHKTFQKLHFHFSFCKTTEIGWMLYPLQWLL